MAKPKGQSDLERDLENEPQPGDPEYAPAPPQVDETPQGTEPRDPNPTRDPPLPNTAPAVD